MRMKRPSGNPRRSSGSLPLGTRTLRRPGISPSQELQTSRWGASLFSAPAPCVTNMPWYGRGMSNSCVSPSVKDMQNRPVRSKFFAYANFASSAAGRMSLISSTSSDTFLMHSVAELFHDSSVSASSSLNISQFMIKSVSAVGANLLLHRERSPAPGRHRDSRT